MHNIVLDENMPYRYVKQLQDLGHLVIHIADEYRGTSDIDVLMVAKKHEAILVTQDSDFGQIIFQDRKQHYLPIIYFRDKDQRKEKMFTQLVGILKTMTLIGKVFVTATPHGVRVRNW